MWRATSTTKTLWSIDHGSPAVWAAYRHAQRRCHGVPALVEWYIDIPPLQVLLDEAGHARQLTDLASKQAEPIHAG